MLELAVNGTVPSRHKVNRGMCHSAVTKFCSGPAAVRSAIFAVAP